MMPSCRFALHLGALLLAGLGIADAGAAAAPPPITAFFANPAFHGAKFSPNGRFLAVKVSSPGKRDGLAVVNLDDNSAKLAAYDDATDINNIEWVNDQRLLFNTTDRQIGAGDPDYAPGLFAVNRDGTRLTPLADRRGKEFAVLGASHIKKRLLPWHTFMLPQAGAQKSDQVYVRSVVYEHNDVRHVDLLSLDTLTGQARTVPRPSNTRNWLLDHNGEPRLAITTEGAVSAIQYRDPATNSWRKLIENDTYLGKRGSVYPLAFGPDGVLYVVSNRGRDTSALYTIDLATGALAAEPLVEAPGYDFDGSLIVSGGRLLGIRLRTDARGTVWFDESMKAVQQEVDKLLPNTINLIELALRPEKPLVLVTSYSDRRPETYLLFNTESKTLNKVGESHPNIDVATSARQQSVRYRARDGLEIPAILTLPQGGDGKQLPLVVLVHGGPYMRGNDWGWEADTQFLASRGYAVLEPDFRGSTGYGAKHFEGGIKQWGLAMQDDIADGVRWAIAKGMVDPKRVCIAGASYGGYAVLMGLIKDPDLYRCGINWVGVTDINLMYDGHWTSNSDLSESWKRYGMPFMIGDQVKDAAQLKATSPLEQAARVTQPLLLAYGALDVRVPPYHGKKFYEAVKAHNKQVEWVLYPDEAHGWWLPSTRIDFWSRVEKFLDKHIGKP